MAIVKVVREHGPRIEIADDAYAGQSPELLERWYDNFCTTFTSALIQIRRTNPEMKPHHIKKW